MENLFKITKYQILNNEVSFETFKKLVEEANIRSIYELNQARKNKKIIVPPINEINRICIEKTGLELADYFEFNNVPIKYQVFKTTKNQILNDEINFETIKSVLKELKIKSQYDIVVAKKNKKIIVPSYSELDNLCFLKKGVKLKDFLDLKLSKTKPRLSERLIEDNFIEKLRSWCDKNNIKSINDYNAFKNRPKEFPTSTTIIKNVGIEYFTEILGVSQYKSNKQSVLLDEEFINELKEWCTNNNIKSIIEYRDSEKPSHFPSAEHIRQVCGKEYFDEILNIAKKFEYHSLENARRICLENGVYTTTAYQEFYSIYNESSELKLPSSISSQYNLNWLEFINLSDTQLFVCNNMSNLELFTYKLLWDRYILFEKEKTFDDCRSINPLPFDFYLPNINNQRVIVELDGIQHRISDKNNLFYSPKTSKHDRIKNEYCKANNIKLIRINKITDIEPTLNKEIGLNNYPKERNLDWTSDFNSESEIISSELSQSLKIKLLLLMCHNGKANLSNIEIIDKVGCHKPHFYKAKNELIALGLIDRETDYFYTDEQKKQIVALYNQGKRISEIIEITGCKTRNSVVDYIKKSVPYYKSKSEKLIESNKKREQIFGLINSGLNISEIARKVGVTPSFASQKIKEYKLENGIIDLDEKMKFIVSETKKLKSEGKSIKDISVILNCTTQYIHYCLNLEKIASR
jgi:transposase-like protein